MLGEICIRHGFKGEQASSITNTFDSNELYFWVNDILENRGMEACLFGYVNAANNEQDISLYWVTKNRAGLPLTPASIQELYNK